MTDFLNRYDSALWMAVVVVSFLAYFLARGIWHKDNKGAVAIAVGVFILAFALVTVSGCTVRPEYQPWMEAGVAYDTQEAVGHNPACVVRVRQPVGFGPLEPDWLIVGYAHQSSCPDLQDRTTVDQLEVVAKIPLGRRK